MKRFIIKGNKCFTGEKVIEDFYFLVENGIIKKIGESISLIQSDIPVIDVKNKLVTPGLIDAHVHICANPYDFGTKMTPFEMAYTIQENLKTMIEQGITAIRDVGAPGDTTLDIKRLINKKKLIGPNLIVAGEAICITGGHGWQMSLECDGVNDIRHAVRGNIKKGVDCIKLMITGGINTKGNELAPLEMDDDEIRVAVEEAHKKGRKVAVHTHGRTGIELALRNNVDSIEHGLLMDKELAEIAKKKGTVVVPTLSAPYFATVEGLKKNPNDKSFKKSQEVMEIHNENIYYAYKIGVLLAMGTDSGTPFNGFETALQELILLNNLGISKIDVLKISTIHGAKLLDIDKTQGTIDIGKKADFIIFNEDPLLDMKNILSEKTVYKDGIKIK